MELLTTLAMLAAVFPYMPPGERYTEQAVRKCRCTGKGLFAGLPYVKVGARVYYKKKDVETFVAAMPTQTNTSQRRKEKNAA